MRRRHLNSFLLVALVATFLPAAISAQVYPCQPMPVGDQFLIGDLSSPGFPDAAMFPDGRAVVVWDAIGDGTDNDRLSIQARLLDASGNPEGDTFQVNTFIIEDQRVPAVGVAPDGRFAIAWESDKSDADFDGTSIRARVYRANGAPVGKDFQVNTVTAGFQDVAAVAMDSQGNFTVAWTSQSSAGNDDSGDSVQARRFNANGTPLGNQFQVNTVINNSQANPAIAMRPDGRSVIVWQSASSAGTDNNPHSIQARRFSASGNGLAPEFQVNTVTQGDQRTPDVAFDTNDRFMVVWENGSSRPTKAQARGFLWNEIGTSQDDVQVNAVITGDKERPKVASVGPGEITATWLGGDPGFKTVQIRSLTTEGEILGEEIEISGGALRPNQPAVAGNGNGSSLVVYVVDNFNFVNRAVIGNRFTHPCAVGVQTG